MKISDFSSKIQDHLPRELVQLFAEQLIQNAPRVGLLITPRIGTTLNLDGIETLSVPTEVLCRIARSCTEGLTHVDISNYNFTDDVLESLSTSSAARAIQELMIKKSRISDATAHAWERFICLRTLIICEYNHLGCKSFESVSKHQTLRHFEYFPGSADSLKFLEMLLSPNALPSLRTLVLRTGKLACSTVLARLFAALSIRPNLHLLERLALVDTTSVDHSDFELVEKIHQLCPNLKEIIIRSSLDVPFSLTGKSSLAKALSNVEDFGFHPIFNFADSDIKSLPELFPRLAKFSFSNPDTFHRWDLFSNLQVLELTSRHITNIQQFECPPHLKTLSIRYSTTRNPTESASDFDKFCTYLCDKAKRLTNLSIVVSDNLITKRHIVSFLTNLLQLEYLTLRNIPSGDERRNARDSFGGAALEIFHPRLRKIPFFASVGAFALPLWMPGLLHWSTNSREKDRSLQALSPSRLPGLRSMELLISPNDDDTAIKRLAQIVQDFEDQVTSLQLSFRMQNVLAALSMMKLGHLAQISVGSIPPAPQSTLESVLKMLPRLSQLKINITWDSTDMDWLEHHHLSELELDLSVPSADEADEPSRMVQFDGRRLPALSDLTMHFKASKLSNLAIECRNMNQLVTCTMQNQSVSPACQLQLATQSCPGLRDLTVKRFQITQFHLLGLPGLLELSLIEVELLQDDSALGRFECPFLGECTVSATANYEEKCGKLFQILKDNSQFPDTLHVSYKRLAPKSLDDDEDEDYYQ